MYISLKLKPKWKQLCGMCFMHFRYSDLVTNSTHKGKAVFEVKLGEYTAGPETIGARDVIDPYFSNDQMEWMTDVRGVIILTALMVQLESEQFCTMSERHAMGKL